MSICLNVNMEPRKAQEAAVVERSGTGGPDRSVGKKPTPLRLGRILVAGGVCGLYRALTRIRYVGACIQLWRIRVWRCHLLGRRRITFAVGCLLGILLHARRAQNRFKIGLLFKQKRLDYLLVSACGPYYQPFGNISFVCRRRPQHIIVNCEDRIVTPRYLFSLSHLWLGLSVLSAHLKFVTIARRLD